MNLPKEILLSTLQLLERSDLKSARLVSNPWCVCASTLLFDTIYVSSAKEDLEAFETVTQNPLLSNCVRHLKYDATEFLERPTKQQYIAELWNQRPSIYNGGKYPSWHTSDSEVNDWVNHVILGKTSIQEAIAIFKDTGLINRGHQSYVEHASFQQSALKSGHFLRRLVQGLRKLSHLREVTMEGCWKHIRGADEMSGSAKRTRGSYFARHWDSFFCRPQKWR